MHEGLDGSLDSNTPRTSVMQIKCMIGLERMMPAGFADLVDAAGALFPVRWREGDPTDSWEEEAYRELSEA